MTSSENNHELKIKIEAGTSIQIKAGLISKSSAKEIINGEEFDGVIEKVCGGDPLSIQSVLPYEDWLAAGDADNLVSNLKRISKLTKCDIDGKKTKFENLIIFLPTAEGYEETFEEAGLKVATMESITQALGPNSAQKIKDYYDTGSEMQSSLFHTLLGGKQMKPVYLWAILDNFKGTIITATVPLRTGITPKVTMVYFVAGEVLPSNDEMIDEDDEYFYPIVGQTDLVMTLTGIVVDDEFVVGELDTDHDTGIQRLILEYRGGGNPVVRYDG